MQDALMIGFAGLAVLIVLIAIRIPIAYAMILVAGVGVTILNGPAIFLSQLKTLAYGQFSIYDLSVVPMFVLMGNISTRAGLSKDLFRAANAWLGWMRGHVCDCGLRRLRRCLRIFTGNRIDHGSGCPAGIEAFQIFRFIGNRHRCCRWRIGHSDPALGGAGDLRDHR